MRGLRPRGSLSTLPLRAAPALVLCNRVCCELCRVGFVLVLTGIARVNLERVPRSHRSIIALVMWELLVSMLHVHDCRCNLKARHPNSSQGQPRRDRS